jgi:hypothetical protein
MNPLIALALKLARPYMVDEIKSQFAAKLPSGPTIAAMNANIDLFDEAVAAYADGKLTRGEKHRLKQKATALAKTLPGLVDSLKTID